MNGDAGVGTDEETKPIITNPQEFFEGFRNSGRYQQAFNAFYQGKNLPADVTEDEKRKVFEERSDGAKEALIEYAQHDTNFKYDPMSGFYSSEAVEALKDYVTQVRDTEKLYKKGGSKEDIQNFDLYRSRLHVVAATALTAQGITPNERLGKAFTRLVLIQNGLDTYQNALIPDKNRLQNMIGG